MADNQYTTIVGFIQFDPDERDIDSGTKVRDISVQPAGSEKTVRVTVWPGFEDTPLKRGDVVVVQGKWTVREAQDREGNTKTYNNMSATRLAVIPAAVQKERDVVNRPTKSPF